MATLITAQQATAQLLAAQTAETLAQEQILVDRYADVFNGIATAITNGKNSYSIPLSHDQATEIKPLLISLGYTVSNNPSFTVTWPVPTTAAKTTSATTGNITAVTGLTSPLSGVSPTQVQGLKDVIYSTTFFIQGGVGPYTWNIVDGILPDGLSLPLTSLTQVVIASSQGEFTCASSTLAVGQRVCITGTLNGDASGLVDRGNYYIIRTNGHTSFTLSKTPDGSAITTQGGTTAGLAFALETPNPTLVLAGTPTTSGTGYFTLSITDSALTTVNAVIPWSISAEANNAYYSRLVTALNALSGVDANASITPARSADLLIAIANKTLVTPPTSHQTNLGPVGAIAIDPTYMYVAVNKTTDSNNITTYYWARFPWNGQGGISFSF